MVYIADGAPFNSRMLASGPLGGAESACIHFVSALARKPYQVTLYTTANESYTQGNLHWRPLSAFKSEAADIVIAHRSPHLFSAYPIYNAQKILYLHNPANYLNKWKHRKYLYLHKPDVVFSGAYHASTWPSFLPRTKHYIIPYAIDPIFTQETARTCPAQQAIFTSNPLRSLDWLLQTWERFIHPALPQATLALYTGPEVYRALKPKKAAAMKAIIETAYRLQDKGIVIHKPVAKEQLVDALRQSRMMLYRGDPGESFCLAMGEAQAMGVPVVTEGIGSCKERVIHAKTGFIAQGQREFAHYAIQLFTDDNLWQQQHRTALQQPRNTWDEASALISGL